jgi:hypothetical protein
LVFSWEIFCSSWLSEWTIIHFPVLLQISHSVGLLMAAGEQISQVSGVHVESTVVGHGGCSYHGHRTGQWWGKD